MDVEPELDAHDECLICISSTDGRSDAASLIEHIAKSVAASIIATACEAADCSGDGAVDARSMAAAASAKPASSETPLRRPSLGDILVGTPRLRENLIGLPEHADDHELGIIHYIDFDGSSKGPPNMFHVWWLRRSSSLSEYHELLWSHPQDTANIWKRARVCGAVSFTEASSSSNGGAGGTSGELSASIVHFDQATPFFTLEGDVKPLLSHCVTQRVGLLNKLRTRTRSSRAHGASSGATADGHPKMKRQKSMHAGRSSEHQAAAMRAATIGDGVEVRTSGLHGAGFGLYASRPFKSCELITMYDGKLLPNGHAEACALETQTHVTTRGGIYWDGYPIAQRFTTDPKLAEGCGGGAFANHDPTCCKAEIYLSQSPGSYNVIYLRVKRGMNIEPGEEIFLHYGTGRALKVSMGHDRFVAKQKKGVLSSGDGMVVAHGAPSSKFAPLPAAMDIGSHVEILDKGRKAWEPAVIVARQSKTRIVARTVDPKPPCLGNLFICEEVTLAAVCLPVALLCASLASMPPHLLR